MGNLLLFISLFIIYFFISNLLLIIIYYLVVFRDIWFFSECKKDLASQLTITCSKLTIETVEKRAISS